MAKLALSKLIGPSILGSFTDPLMLIFPFTLPEAFLIIPPKAPCTVASCICFTARSRSNAISFSPFGANEPVNAISFPRPVIVAFVLYRSPEVLSTLITAFPTVSPCMLRSLIVRSLVKTGCLKMFLNAIVPFIEPLISNESDFKKAVIVDN